MASANHARTLTIAGLVLAAPASNELLPSAAAVRTLARVTLALEDLYQERPPATAADGDRIKALNSALDQLITDLGSEVAADVARGEGRSLAAKLVAIGLDRRARPGSYDALGRVYGDHSGAGEVSRAGNAVGPGPVALRPEHVREEYRLAWEYRLLVFPALREVGPRTYLPPGGPLGGQQPPKLEAIQRIGSEASIPALTWVFRHVCRDDIDGGGQAVYREYLLDAIEARAGLAALLAVLDYAEWAELQWARRGPTYLGPRGGKPSEWVTRLADAPEPARGRWRAAGDSAAAETLPPRQRELLTLLKVRFAGK